MVCASVQEDNPLVLVCASVWSITHSPQLVDYLPMPMHKSYNNYSLSIYDD